MIYATDNYSKEDMNKFNEAAKLMNVDLQVILDLAESRSILRCAFDSAVHVMKNCGLNVNPNHCYAKGYISEYTFNSKKIKWTIGATYNAMTGGIILTINAGKGYNFYSMTETFNSSYAIESGKGESAIRTFINDVLRDVNNAD